MYIYIYILIPHLYANAYQLRRLRFLWRNGPWPNSGPRGPPGVQGKPGPPGTHFTCFTQYTNSLYSLYQYTNTNIHTSAWPPRYSLYLLY